MSASDQVRSGKVKAGKVKSGAVRSITAKSGKAGAIPDGATADHDCQRLDKWLWFTRVIKTRSLATRLVSGGKIRVNRVKCDKPAQAVRKGDVITATIGRSVRVLQILELGKRRGPAPEAQALYEDLAPMPEHDKRRPAAADSGISPAVDSSAHREPGTGRPTKRERRQTDRLRCQED